jgi:hypothetical protein
VFAYVIDKRRGLQVVPGKLIGLCPQEFKVLLEGFGWSRRGYSSKPKLKNEVDLELFKTRYFPLVFHRPEKSTDVNVLQCQFLLEFSAQTVMSFLSRIDMAAREKSIVRSPMMGKEYVPIDATDSSHKVAQAVHDLSWAKRSGGWAASSEASAVCWSDGRLRPPG